MEIVTVRLNPELAYPALGDLSPAERFPETPVDDEETGGNAVYAAVRRALADAGADAARFGSPDWNPLGDWIDSGSRVFVLPNFVVDQRPGESDDDFAGKCTHASFLRPVLDYAMIATGDPGSVRFGNAPLQSCDHAKVAQQTGATQLSEFYRRHFGISPGPVDLRGYVSEWTRYGALVSEEERDPADVVLVDLGSDSLLEPLFAGKEDVEFRVTDYDHREIALYHAPGKHVYAINRHVLEADNIISAPKLKTHEKVGITCALKGMVGTIALKQCLAHHRKGGQHSGGDEFPGDSAVRGLASEWADRVTVLGQGPIANTLRITAKALYKSLRLGSHGIMAGGWHGNDTAWRMALDIARIVRFARADGTLSDSPQRTHLVFVDGVVGGEGEGPVFPQGRRDGVVMFGTDAAWSDYACALLMGFDPAAIPLIREGVAEMRYPASDQHDPEQVRVVIDGTDASLPSLPSVLDSPFTPPKGWIGVAELELTDRRGPAGR